MKGVLPPLVIAVVAVFVMVSVYYGITNLQNIQKSEISGFLNPDYRPGECPYQCCPSGSEVYQPKSCLNDPEDPFNIPYCCESNYCSIGPEYCNPPESDASIDDYVLSSLVLDLEDKNKPLNERDSYISKTELWTDPGYFYYSNGLGNEDCSNGYYCNECFYLFNVPAVTGCKECEGCYKSSEYDNNITCDYCYGCDGTLPAYGDEDGVVPVPGPGPGVTAGVITGNVISMNNRFNDFGDYEECTECYDCFKCDGIDEINDYAESCYQCSSCADCKVKEFAFYNADIGCNYCKTCNDTTCYGCEECGTPLPPPIANPEYNKVCYECSVHDSLNDEHDTTCSDVKSDYQFCEKIKDAIANYEGLPMEIEYFISDKDAISPQYENMLELLRNCSAGWVYKNLADGGQQTVCYYDPTRVSTDTNANSDIDVKSTRSYFNIFDCGGTQYYDNAALSDQIEIILSEKSINKNNINIYGSTDWTGWSSPLNANSYVFAIRDVKYHTDDAAGFSTFDITKNYCNFNMFVCDRKIIATDKNDKILNLYKKIIDLNLPSTTFDTHGNHYDQHTPYTIDIGTVSDIKMFLTIESAFDDWLLNNYDNQELIEYICGHVTNDNTCVEKTISREKSVVKWQSGWPHQETFVSTASTIFKNPAIGSKINMTVSFYASYEDENLIFIPSVTIDRS